jgi:hypothetical protein
MHETLEYIIIKAINPPIKLAVKTWLSMGVVLHATPALMGVKSKLVDLLELFSEAQSGKEITTLYRFGCHGFAVFIYSRDRDLYC